MFPISLDGYYVARDAVNRKATSGFSTFRFIASLRQLLLSATGVFVVGVSPWFVVALVGPP